MKFKFAYDNILKHKRTLEELAKRDFAVAQSHVDKAKQELEELYFQLDQARIRVGDLVKAGGSFLNEVGVINDFIEMQKCKIEERREFLRRLMFEAEQKQMALMAAAREFKTFDKLKEKKFVQFKDRLKKADLKAVDELVTTRFGKEGKI